MPAADIRTATLATPVGPLTVLACGETLVGCGFTAAAGDLRARLEPPLASLPMMAADLPWAVKPLLGYFEGDLTAIDDLPVRQHGSAGRKLLWQALRAVPAGTTVSYNELAGRAGLLRGARAAGSACAANLIAPVVPCHRVVRATGHLGGYYYGLDRKEWLLRHERQHA